MGKASFSVGKLTQHSQSHINRENGLNYAVVENSRANSFNKYYEYDDFYNVPRKNNQINKSFYS